MSHNSFPTKFLAILANSSIIAALLGSGDLFMFSSETVYTGFLIRSGSRWWRTRRLPQLFFFFVRLEHIYHVCIWYRAMSKCRDVLVGINDHHFSKNYRTEEYFLSKTTERKPWTGMDFSELSLDINCWLDDLHAVSTYSVNISSEDILILGR